MQSAKDSVYVAFRERLAVVNSQRTIEIAGRTRPAVTSLENSAISAPATNAIRRDTFELKWGAAEVVESTMSARRQMMKIECQISYKTSGDDPAGADRGRTLGAMDVELVGMCTPLHTAKQDYSQLPPAPLGTTVFWGHPQFGAVEDKAGVLHRTAKLSVFFFPEVSAA
jgi:hypothetical protein